MENYENKLLSLDSQAGVPVRPLYSSAGLFDYAESQNQINGNLACFENALKTLAYKLSFEINEWPKFGGYNDENNQVEVTQLYYNIFSCERGCSSLRSSSKNFIDAAYEAFEIAIPD